MTAFRLALRALTRPITLLSLAALLLNDHVLKQAAPSFVTGKLSDFAGLFFFPFLLAALLGVFTSRLRLAPGRTFALAWAVTLVWFTLIKTTSWANAATTALVELLLGGPVQFVRDPTDCAALIVLWPAWRLWRRLEREPRPAAPGPREWAALSLAALATIATSPAIPPPSVARLVVEGEVVYAGFTVDSYWHRQAGVSSDGGRSWSLTDQIPNAVANALFESPEPAGQVCDPLDDRHCFRLKQGTVVEESVDGGQTWRIGWQTPWGREAFMRRRRLLVNDVLPDPIVSLRDLAFVQREGASTLIVAAGQQGVLVRTPDGAWGRYGVESAIPRPYATWDPIVIMLATQGELTLALAAGAILLVGLGFWMWGTLVANIRSRRRPGGRALKWAFTPLLQAGAILLLAFGAAIAIDDSRYGPTSALLELWWIWLAGPLSLIGAALAWRRLASLTARPITAQRAGWLALGLIVLIPLAAYLPFALWAMWVIPLYEIALIVAIAITFAGLYRGWRSIRRLLDELQRSGEAAPPAV